jgi:DnaJ homolog subfamily C member 2
VGSAYLAHARRTIHKRTLQEDLDELREQQRLLEENKANGAFNDEDDLGVGDEEESPELLARDAKEWKVIDRFTICSICETSSSYHGIVGSRPLCCSRPL